MFDVGFSELILVAIVALVVVGPERLPKLARTAGLWIGKGRAMVNSVKAEIDREIKADELKQMLAKREKLNPLHEVIETTQTTLADAGREASAAIESARSATDNSDNNHK